MLTEEIADSLTGCEHFDHLLHLSNVDPMNSDLFIGCECADLFDRASSCPIMTVLTLKTIDRK
jgi:hypothetical protein